MRTYLLLFCAALLPLGAIDARGQDTSVYIVSYIEVVPNDTRKAANLLRELATASRKDEGNLRFEPLQRTAPSNQFTIVAIWKDQKAYEANRDAAHSKKFAEQIQPMLITPIDNRVHTGMAVAPSEVKAVRGAVYVVTHVDVPPPSKDKCVDALTQLVEASRKEPGAMRFEVFQQSNRPNHFTVVEMWKGQKEYIGHITAAHTRKFRSELTPMTGALYDERLHKSLE
jgi:quinol monooxygenase YgiN